MAGIEKALYIRIDSRLKERITHQCKRLNITQSGFAKMALVRFVEGEEKTEAIVLQR